MTTAALGMVISFAVSSVKSLFNAEYMNNLCVLLEKLTKLS